LTLNAISSPDKLSINQILLSSAQEIFGEGDVCTNFSQNGLEFEHNGAHTIEKFQSYLQKQCGCTGGRGAAILAGRSMFNTILRCAGESLGWFDSNFCMLPLSQRLKKGLQNLARQWGKMNHKEITLQEMDDHWLWVQSMPPFQSASAGHCCDLTVGLLQEFTSWLSGGKFFDVQEIPPVDEVGTTRFIKVSKRALD
jgi:hypothetical protein